MTSPRRAKPRIVVVAHSVFDHPLDEEGNAIMPVPLAASVDGQSVLHGEIQLIPEFAGRGCYKSFDRPNPKTFTNRDYLQNIATQNHGNVMEHASVTFYVTGVSRSLSHELVRHRHMTPSQESQRYVPIDELRVVPPVLLEEAVTKHGEMILGPLLDLEDPEEATLKLQDYVDRQLDEWAEETAFEAIRKYRAEESFLRDVFPEAKKKVIREAAREHLPNCAETSLTVTGNFRAWLEFLMKRDSLAADKQFQRLAKMLAEDLAAIAPNVFDEVSRSLWTGAKAQEAPK